MKKKAARKPNPKRREPSAWQASFASRVAWVDAAQGCGIAFIVLGHCLLGLLSAKLLAETQVTRFVLLFIYMFHFPLIFFISGLISRDHEKKWNAFMDGQLRYLILPYFIWSLILVLIQKLSPYGVNDPIGLAALPKMLWQPISVYWLLYVFFLVRLVNYAMCRLAGDGRAVWILLVLTLFLSSLQPDFWLVGKTISCLFFYELGRLQTIYKKGFDKLMVTASRTIWLWIPSLFVPVGVLAAIAFTYLHTPTEAMSPLYDFQSRILLTGTLGIWITILLARAGEKFAISFPLRIAGIYSMAIYVQHTIWGAAIRCALVKTGVTNPAIYIAVIVLGGLLLPVLWQVACDRLKWTKFFGIRPLIN